LRSHPKYFDAVYALGILYLQRKDHRAAEKQFSLAARIHPNNSPLQNNLGNALVGLDRREEALAAYDKAIAIDPNNWEAHYNRGNVLAALNRHEEALASFDRAISLFPYNAEVHDNRGSTLAYLRRFEEALASFNQAIKLDPKLARAYANRAMAHSQFKQYDKAREDYDIAYRLDPTLDYLIGNRLHAKQFDCCWEDFASDCTALIEGVRSGTLKAEPFGLFPIPSSAEDQLKCAAQFIRDKAPASPRMPWHGRRYDHDRIRLGYVSSDFQNHPTSHLLAGVLEAHDRGRFTVYGFSTGPESNDEYRRRVSAACDAFVDARGLSNRTFVDEIRKAEIDILIDLNGLTTGRRTEVFAMRPAPVQVNYLGFPGTMGAGYIDYLIADRHLIAPEESGAYAEKIVYLPHSYQPNDAKRAVSPSVPTREQQGLPAQGVVFCSFNNTFKITPDIFDVWMRILKAVDGSVLWIFCESLSARANLKREAEQRGSAAERLVFAERMPPADHRARHALADIFLDTLYYNAHTTASDALWAGVPVVTRRGATFASRVATSLLHAAGLPEMVTQSLEAYEQLAVRLAKNPAELAAVKAKLATNRGTCPLFDTLQYTRDLEAAFTRMWELSRKGKPPQSISVEPAEATS
jgi:predicted O-linked N-acetylglucosamine transferase (SPINDLY family)